MNKDRNDEFDRWYRENFTRVLAGIRIVSGAEFAHAEDAAQLAFMKASP